MKHKTLAISAALLLLLALPLAAQQPDETDPTQGEVVTENSAQVNVDAEAQIGEEGDDFQTEGDFDADAELDADASLDDDTELPQTASPLALLALLGLGSATAAAGVRTARRK